MLLDVFRTDPFHFTKLVGLINKVPYVPTRLGSLGYFEAEGVSTLSVAIEIMDNVLTLVPSAPRGAPGPVKSLQRRVVKDFRTTSLPQRAAVMADEVLALRAPGTEQETEVATRYLQRKLAIPRRDLDITHEWQRMGALNGQVLDADGSTVLYDFFNEFGVSKTTAAINLTSSSTKVLQSLVAMLRTQEDKLGGLMATGVRGLCSPESMDLLTGNAEVRDQLKYTNQQGLRSDYRRSFEYAGIVFEEYRGTVGGQRFIPANKIRLVPEGVPGLFKTYFSPAPYMDTVGTEGLPFYMRGEDMPFNKGIEYEILSNPLHLCTRPDAVIEVTTS